MTSRAVHGAKSGAYAADPPWGASAVYYSDIENGGAESYLGAAMNIQHNCAKVTMPNAFLKDTHSRLKYYRSRAKLPFACVVFIYRLNYNCSKNSTMPNCMRLRIFGYYGSIALPVGRNFNDAGKRRDFIFLRPLGFYITSMGYSWFFW